MSLRRAVLGFGVGWVVIVSALHSWLNLGWQPWHPAVGNVTGSHEVFRVGYLPVTCHLTCPVTDFIREQLGLGGGSRLFEPVRFSGFPELKEAFLAGYLPATLMLAPLALALREQGVP